MNKALVVVESAAKARTIEKFLGTGYQVMASGGHVRDLPGSGLAVDIENGFRPQFVVVPDRTRILNELKAKARRASEIYLATDPDREGEAISHDLAEEFQAVLGSGKRVPIRRMTFQEITRPAIRRALAEAGDIDQNRVKAQQTRRVLDRIVGYKISPLLSRKLAGRLSAGRVQSVALRLICEREREIRAFTVEEYWNIEVHLRKGEGKSFLARADLGKGRRIRDEATAGRIRDELAGCTFRVESVESKRRQHHPPPPFITSTMQRQASSAFGFPAARTMRAAQSLYEGVDLGSGERVGLITYLRTDSTRVSEQAIREVREAIHSRFGDGFLPEKPNRYRSRKGAQDAHEAIRPTSTLRDPKDVARFLNEDQTRLYRMVWERFVASQMRPAVSLRTRAVIAADPPPGRPVPEIPGFGTPPNRVVAVGSVMLEQGYQVLYRETREDGGDEDGNGKQILPPLQAKEELRLREVVPTRHFTAPPRRYSEASLIRKLEENGIGRPSTYVPILRKIKQREYVRTKKRVFMPTEVGMLVSDLLTLSFDDLINVRYTAAMEANLDRIEQGKADYTEALEAFYGEFVRNLERAKSDMPRLKSLPTDESCDQCGRPLALRWSGGEKFLGCVGFPECRGSRSLDTAEESVEETSPCPECGAPMAARRGRFGPFLGCTRYPDCQTIIQIRDGQAVPKPAPEPVGEDCPECGKPMVRRRSRRGPFVGCSGFPKCSYIKPQARPRKKAAARRTGRKTTPARAAAE